jgi:hypothetical protein
MQQLLGVSRVLSCGSAAAAAAAESSKLVQSVL